MFGGVLLEKWNKKDEVTSQMVFSVQKNKTEDGCQGNRCFIDL